MERYENTFSVTVEVSETQHNAGELYLMGEAMKQPWKLLCSTYSRLNMEDHYKEGTLPWFPCLWFYDIYDALFCELLACDTHVGNASASFSSSSFEAKSTILTF